MARRNGALALSLFVCATFAWGSFAMSEPVVIDGLYDCARATNGRTYCKKKGAPASRQYVPVSEEFFLSYEAARNPSAPPVAPPPRQDYVGDLKDGIPHGWGAYTWPDGQKYVGQFTDGQRTGQAVWTSPDGQRYVGEFVDGQMHGQGVYTFPDGQKYVGEYKENRRSGHGIWTYANGEQYVGEFKDDIQDGVGVLYAADRTVKLSGVWENGQITRTDSHSSGH